MSDPEDRAENEVKSRVRKLQRRGEIPGQTFRDLEGDTQRKLKRWARNYAATGEEPDQAGRHAIRRAKRDGLLP